MIVLFDWKAQTLELVMRIITKERKQTVAKRPISFRSLVIYKNGCILPIGAPLSLRYAAKEKTLSKQ